MRSDEPLGGAGGDAATSSPFEELQWLLPWLVAGRSDAQLRTRGLPVRCWSAVPADDARLRRASSGSLSRGRRCPDGWVELPQLVARLRAPRRDRQEGRRRRDRRQPVTPNASGAAREVYATRTPTRRSGDSGRRDADAPSSSRSIRATRRSFFVWRRRLNMDREGSATQRRILPNRYAETEDEAPKAGGTLGSWRYSSGIRILSRS